MRNGEISGHLTISWPMLAMAGALGVSIITGAIQLGGVQTHVLINTDRLSTSEQREREHLVAIAKIQARQEMNERRIATIEEHDVKTREIEAQIIEKLAAIAAVNSVVLERHKAEK